MIEKILHTIKNGNSNRICCIEEFYRVLRRERARSDRNHYKFSLIVYKTNRAEIDYKKLIHLQKVLDNRIRSTDVIGWLKRDELGVLLFDVSKRRVKEFCSDVMSLLSSDADYFPPSIYVYPNKLELHNADKLGPNQNKNVAHASSTTTKKSIGEITKDVRKKTKINQKTKELSDYFAETIPLWKRSMDFVCSICAIVLLSPLFLLVSLYIKCVSSGTILYKQERIGYKGKSFKLLKFRTMRDKEETDLHQQYMKSLIKTNALMTKLDKKNDPRIIPLGKIFRLLSLDELPQFFNILKGDMSLIGPRPCLPYEKDNYLRWYKRRFDVLPGLTGNWQVNGKNKTTFLEMVRLDISYIKDISLMNDIKILMKTIPAILNQVYDAYRNK